LSTFGLLTRRMNTGSPCTEAQRLLATFIQRGSVGRSGLLRSARGARVPERCPAALVTVAKPAPPAPLRCVECAAEAPADADGWKTYLTSDEPPEAATVLPGLRGSGVRARRALKAMLALSRARQIALAA
jgi:hypothetical protein